MAESSRPNAFAILRLITGSNFVGCSIGNSPGLAPFNICQQRSLLCETHLVIGAIRHDPPAATYELSSNMVGKLVAVRRIENTSLMLTRECFRRHQKRIGPSVRKVGKCRIELSLFSRTRRHAAGHALDRRRFLSRAPALPCRGSTNPERIAKREISRTEHVKDVEGAWNSGQVPSGSSRSCFRQAGRGTRPDRHQPGRYWRQER